MKHCIYIRWFEKKFGVEGERLIASGRSKYAPVADNSTKQGRALNRRTTILLMPNVEHYMALLNGDMGNQSYESSTGAKANQNKSEAPNNTVMEPKSSQEKENQKEEVFGMQKDNNTEGKTQTDTTKQADSTQTKAKEETSNRQNRKMSLREKRAAEQRKRAEAAKKRREERQRQKDSIREAIKNRGRDQ